MHRIALSFVALVAGLASALPAPGGAQSPSPAPSAPPSAVPPFVPPTPPAPSPATASPASEPSAAPSSPTPGSNVPTEAPETAAPEATASASPSATPQAPLPSQIPLPSASPVPIRLDRTRIGIVPGGAAAVGVAGGVPPLAVQASFAGVVPRFDRTSGTLFLSARSAGRGTVTLTDAAGDTASLTVLVAPPAATLPAAATVELAGTVSAAFVAAQVRDAIARASALQPGTTIAVSGVTPVALAPGGSLDARAHVAVSGNDRYVDVQGDTGVHVAVDSLPVIDPLVLFYSDDPERLGPGDDGVLFRGTSTPAHPVRTYAYHVSDTPDRRLYVALNASAGPARVQVIAATAGPSDAFSYVGHLATLRYLLQQAPQQSLVAALAPGTPLLLPLSAGPMLAGQLVAAIADVRVVDGANVDVSVVSASSGSDPLALLGTPERPGDAHGRRGEFSIANVPPFALAYTVGGPEPAPFLAGSRNAPDGSPYFPNLRPGQPALAGDYGVLRAVSLQLANPGPDAQTVYLYEQPLGGPATTTIWFAGDDAPTEVRCAGDRTARFLVKSFALAPGETRTVGGMYMTDGTSYLPIAFGLTSTAPAPVPPNACNGAPPASPAAQPSAAPTPPGR